jgi:hypothetical protein
MLSTLHRALVVAGCVPQQVVLGRDIDLWDASLGPLLATALAVDRGEWRASTKAVRARQLGSMMKGALRTRKAIDGTSNVVFVLAHNTHIVPCLAIAKVLTARGTHASFLASNDKLTSAVGASCITLRPSTVDIAAAMVRATTIRHDVMSCAESLSMDPTLAEALATTVVEQLPNNLAMARMMTRLHRSGTRRLVVGNDLTIPGRMAALVARAAGWFCSSPMHGVVSGEPLQGHHVVDRVLCWGHQATLDMEAEGEAPARLVAVGAPGRLRHAAAPTLHGDVRRLLGNRNHDKPAVLVALSGPGHSVSARHHQDTIASLVALAKGDDVDVVVKLHPKDDAAFYRAAMAGRSRLFLSVDLDHQPPFASWLDGMSMVITTTSASGADAILAGVPVVCLDLHGDAVDQDYVRAGAVARARSTEELISVVRGIIKVGLSPQVIGASDEYVRNSFLAFGDDAAIRAAAVVMSETHRHSNGGAD